GCHSRPPGLCRAHPQKRWRALLHFKNHPFSQARPPQPARILSLPDQKTGGRKLGGRLSRFGDRGSDHRFPSSGGQGRSLLSPPLRPRRVLLLVVCPINSFMRRCLSSGILNVPSRYASGAAPQGALSTEISGADGKLLCVKTF